MLKKILISLGVIFTLNFTGCGSVETTTKYELDTDNLAEYESMKIFKDYAKHDGDAKAPNISDYKAIGIDDIDNNTILVMANKIISEADMETVEKPSDILGLLYKFGILKPKASSPLTSIPTPTVTPTPTPIPTQSTAQTFKSTLKKTGQTTSYEQFDDGEYQIGMTPSYTRSGEIVTDNITALQWQDNDEAKTVEKNWEDAKSYCSALSLEDRGDWRLPTRKELNSIVDYSKVDPAIYSTFENVASSYYQSSTTSGMSDSLWGVSFYNGNDYWNGKTYELYVRCVRHGQ